MMALVMLIALFPVTTAYAALTGSGTATDPYLIATQEDLMAMGSDSAGKFYKLQEHKNAQKAGRGHYRHPIWR